MRTMARCCSSPTRADPLEQRSLHKAITIGLALATLGLLVTGLGISAEWRPTPQPARHAAASVHPAVFPPHAVAVP